VLAPSIEVRESCVDSTSSPIPHSEDLRNEVLERCIGSSASTPHADADVEELKDNQIPLPAPVPGHDRSNLAASTSGDVLRHHTSPPLPVISVAETLPLVVVDTAAEHPQSPSTHSEPSQVVPVVPPSEIPNNSILFRSLIDVLHEQRRLGNVHPNLR
jgi:hypothetical protein